jgi:hypothetical protein
LRKEIVNETQANGKIYAPQFFRAWFEAVQIRKEHLLSIWRQSSIFTSHVKGDDVSIMKEVADKLNLLCYNRDYYCIDTILYKEEDLVPDRPKGSYWFRDIRVAFEHENKSNSGLYQEASHLLITNCDLRVLVTYPNGDGQNELEDLHKIIKGNRSSKAISDEESFLIIFGYESDFVWEAFVYKEDNWKEIGIAYLQ